MYNACSACYQGSFITVRWTSRLLTRFLTPCGIACRILGPLPKKLALLETAFPTLQDGECDRSRALSHLFLSGGTAVFQTVDELARKGLLFNTPAQPGSAGPVRHFQPKN
jgi:hypothetical protein